MISFLACLKAGIIAVPVFPPNPLRKDTLYMFSRIVKGCDAKFALTNVEYNHAKKVAGIKDSFTRFQRTATASTAASWPESLEWIVTDKKLVKTKSTTTTTTTTTYSASDLAFLQYTSGSTSEPKGVMITHGNLAHNLSIITKELEADATTIVVSWLPQYHDMGLIGSYLGILYCGGTGYYMSPLAFLQRPVLWMEAAAKYQATHLQAPNFSFKLTARKFQALAQNTYTPQTLNLSSVKHVINAAEPIDEDSIETFYKAFGPFGFGKVIFPTYGLAEHCVFVCSGGTQRLAVLKRELEVDGKVTLAPATATSTDISRLVGCGYPARQGVDVQIVDTESFKPVMEDVVGEIWIHSPSKAAGYFHKPDETKHDFHAVLASGESDTDTDDANKLEYLRTGDLGFLHQEELFICGRLKDLIIVGGRNFYPQDIEGTAEAASDLVRLGCSAAFSIDTTRQGGEEVALVMELKEVPSPKEVESVCVSLANQIRSSINQEHSLGITEIAFLQPRSVPKTSSGKIARAWCRKGFVAGTLKVVYRKSFKSDMSSFEIEPTEDGSKGKTTCNTGIPMSAGGAETIRAMSKEALLGKLTSDVSRVGSIPPESIDKKAALVTMMDSITLSQFKGLLESHYAVKISDEYLFRESTTVTKLVEVAKLGYAPDDDADANANPDGPGPSPPNAPSQSPPGGSGGCAGALGCPPGVVCTIL
jgi:acyl-CoA synthetase (AMP-forming)/AMP-acid ligase II